MKYNKNHSSHFRTLINFLRICLCFLKFSISSIVCAGVDLTAFTLLSSFIFERTSSGIFASTIIARCISGVLNFIVNKKWCFGSRGDNIIQAIKYFTLACSQMLLSWLIVSLLSRFPVHLTVLKIIADSSLFVISYFVQRILIFKKDLPKIKIYAHNEKSIKKG